jgi:TRAP-type C4-dicarboxylate transport system substrate-binding protein
VNIDLVDRQTLTISRERIDSSDGGAMMKWTSCFRVAVSVILGVLVISSAVMAADDVIELKLAHFMPTMHIQHREAFEPFAEKVAELTDGKVQVKIFPGATLGNPKTMVDAIRTGITDIGFVLPSYVPGRFQKSSVFELPFIFDNATHVAKVFYDNYDKYFAEDYKGFKLLWALSSPLSQCHTAKKAVLTAEDFVGMKIRSGGAKETVGIKKLGANPIGMPISELSISLQKGVVDGAFTPYAALNSHKLIDIVQHITEINYSGSLMVVLMNKKKWESLPDFAKEAIDQVATEEFGLKAAGAFDQEDLENVESGKAKGIEFHKLSKEEKLKVLQNLKGIWADWVEENTSKFPARELLDAVLASAKANK